jgi:teichuronic acid biosynthesis glycosyltransferase TuaG
MESISVIIPNYNRSALLRRAVESVLNQTVEVKEIIICDDGSTDDSKEIIHSLNNPKISWLDCGRNGRPAIPRNAGIRKSIGEWLAFLDNDDQWLPSKIQSQLEKLKTSGRKAACTNAVSQTSEIKNTIYSSFEKSIVTNEDLIKSNYVICSSAMVHRSVLDSSGGFPEDETLKALEDYALWLKISCYTDFDYIQEPLVLYNDEASESIRSQSESTYRQRKKVYSYLTTWADNTLPQSVFANNFWSALSEAETILKRGLFSRLWHKYIS